MVTKTMLLFFFFIKPDSRQKIHIGTKNVNYKFKLRRVYKIYKIYKIKCDKDFKIHKIKRKFLVCTIVTA